MEKRAQAGSVGMGTAGHGGLQGAKLCAASLKASSTCGTAPKGRREGGQLRETNRLLQNGAHGAGGRGGPAESELRLR